MLAELDDLTATGDNATMALTITVDDAASGAAGVTALNTIAAGTTGTVTANISGNAAELDDLTATGTTATQAYTITVDDTATAAAGAAIADATSIANTGVNFALGITDSFASVTTGAAIHSNIGKIDAKDANVNITVNDTAANVSADNVSAINALQAATTGTITATIDGNLAELDNLTATGDNATMALTITVDDAASGAAGVTALNTISDATTGTVTAGNVSGTATQLAVLQSSGGDNATQAYTITVDDAATALEGKTITEATNVGTVDFSAAGINDAFAAVTNGTSVHANMAAVDAKDADVNITVNDTVGNVSADNVTAINALQAATTGTITATIDGNAAELDGLTATGDNATMALTITVDDTATASEGQQLRKLRMLGTVDFSAAGITDCICCGYQLVPLSMLIWRQLMLRMLTSTLL